MQIVTLDRYEHRELRNDKSIDKSKYCVCVIQNHDELSFWDAAEKRHTITIKDFVKNIFRPEWTMCFLVKGIRIMDHGQTILLGYKYEIAYDAIVQECFR